ncbi:unnamed protein product [Strongylus vulgaris]|uniref:SCP domain-containing protein n=1 Tax=Strongylus vulgaris TaxID=40348 RepID=A0A3P7ICS8_STRVU|nr:unnamed protein product [Strongylus vulgaris]
MYSVTNAITSRDVSFMASLDSGHHRVQRRNHEHCTGFSLWSELLGPSSSTETITEDKSEARREKRGYFFPQIQYHSNSLLISPDPPNDYLKKWITYEHNRYRRMVPASDMNMLYWSEELAASAQRHANTCDFRHSKGRVNVGENIWAAPYSNYSDAISIWFNEVSSRSQYNLRLAEVLNQEFFFEMVEL